MGRTRRNSPLRISQMPVEFVGRTPGYPWMTQIVVSLPDALAHAGDVNVQVAVRGSEVTKRC